MGKPTEKQKIGCLGEDIAVKYLENKGYTVKCRNYLKKYGEIDIIAQKGKILHFIEVKSVSELASSRLGRSEKNDQLSGDLKNNVSRQRDSYRPEDNIHPFKLKRLSRTIQAYLLEKYLKGEPEWVFDAITIRIDMKNRQAYVKYLADLVL